MTFPDPQSFWDQRFTQPGYLFGTEPNVFLASQANLLKPGGKALSVADGEGRNSVWLAQQGLDVVALEISPVAVEKARRLAAVLEWDFGAASYDVIAAIFIQFLSPPQRSLVFRRIVQALRPGGCVILQGYTPQQIEYKTGGPPLAENMYTEALLREAFAGLEVLHLREHEAHVAEGTGHLGWSALIDFAGRMPAA
jgi:SAM-dependent methyltransferase